MTITLAESMTACEDLLRDHAGLLTSPAVLAAWLDQGQKDVAALTLCYQQVATYRHTDSPQAFAAGQRSYSVSAAIGAAGLGLSNHLLTTHLLLNGVPLFLWTPPMVGLADVRLTAGGGTPHYYYEFAGALGFFPYPDAAFLASAFTLEVTYAARPADWESGASVLPPACDELPIFFAVVRAAIQRRHWPVAALWFGMYWSQILNYRLTSGLQFATPQTQRQQPVALEREDEPRRLTLLSQARQRARAGRRG